LSDYLRALEWERHQKQTRHLLIAQDLQQAESWLSLRFEDGQQQAPCEPTDLQCEFICESIKNAHNLLTQVFISYAPEDNQVMAKVSKTLMRAGITVWVQKTINVFSEALEQGIEGADNLIVLVSPAAVQSKMCQRQLNYALSYNKRVILLLIANSDLSQFPPLVDSVDCTAPDDDGHYRHCTDELLHVLQEEAHYHRFHKILLVKALKWREQNYNPSILLRGYNLQHFEAWLKTAQQRHTYLPLHLHEEFITASLRQPAGLSQEVFISYSRSDADFARRLNDALQIQGKTTWFDQESIASGTDFQQEIYQGIANSDNFLFIISPNSINSPYCADEVEYAYQLNKRFITLLYRPVILEEVHPLLVKIQWIDFN
jgi:hypothetical protein